MRHKEYRKKWVEAGYDSRMGSAEATLPPPAAYRRVYHFTSANHALTDLVKGDLKVARFRDLNDQFELISLNLKGKHTRLGAKRFRGDFDNIFGLVCFSANWTSPLLWGHYADKHKGICLGFNLHRELEHRVDYLDRRIESALENYKNLNDLPDVLKEKLFCTKSSDWSYEQEYRILVPLSDAIYRNELHFYPFGVGANLQLAEVIFGKNCPKNIEKEAREIAIKKYPRATVYNSRLAWKHFAVVPKESTIP